jgi:hypothetical protein
VLISDLSPGDTRRSSLISTSLPAALPNEEESHLWDVQVKAYNTSVPNDIEAKKSH